MAHASIEGNLGDDVHASVAKLEGDHGYVRLTSFPETPTATSIRFHFVFFDGFVKYRGVTLEDDCVSPR